MKNDFAIVLNQSSCQSDYLVCLSQSVSLLGNPPLSLPTEQLPTEQLPTEKWYEMKGDNRLAVAILDRIN